MPLTIVDRSYAGGGNRISSEVSNKEICLMICAVNVERNVGLAAETGFIPEGEDELLNSCRRIDPRIEGEIIGSHHQAARSARDEDVAAAVEIERLSDLAGGITLGALPGAIVVVLMIASRPIAGPPVLQVRGRRRAGAALANAAGINNCLNFRLRQRPTDDLDFVDLSLPEVPVRWASDGD